MASVRLEALRALRDAMEAGVHELAGRVTPWLPNRTPSRPRLAVIPVSSRFIPNQAEEVHDPAPDSVVMNVGWHEALVQMRLEHDTPEQRIEVQDKILGLFLERTGSPGVLVTQAVAAPFGTFIASWELEEDAWNDDEIFNNEYESLITVTGHIPALVVRREAYRIRDLRLGIAHEMNVEWTDPAVSVVRVNGDGTITPV